VKNRSLRMELVKLKNLVDGLICGYQKELPQFGPAQRDKKPVTR